MIKIVILVILFGIFIQDIVSRAVYWILFPVLALLFISSRVLGNRSVNEIWQPVLFNLGFLFLQMLLVSVYFSVKRKNWVNVTVQLIGWGDILLLICISFYLSFLNFLFFYIASLIASVLIGFILFSKKNKQIPLAGLQALALMIYLANDWWLNHINVTSDYWLQQFLIK